MNRKMVCFVILVALAACTGTPEMEKPILPYPLPETQAPTAYPVQTTPSHINYPQPVITRVSDYLLDQWSRYDDVFLTMIPMLMAALVAWLLIKRGQILSGVLLAYAMLIALWISIEYLSLYNTSCKYNDCGVIDYLRNFWGKRALVFYFFVPITLATLGLRFSIQRRKPFLGFLGGLLIIFINWLAFEWTTYRGCQECLARTGYPLCCEWTGLGMMVLTVISLCEVAVFLVISWGMCRYYKRRLNMQLSENKIFNRTS